MPLFSGSNGITSALPISEANVSNLVADLAAKASVAGTPVVRGPFSFAFNTPNLTTGVTLFTPTVNDILIDAWIELDTAFNGTTPLADVGQFVGVNNGLFYFNNPVDLTLADDAISLAPSLLSGQPAGYNIGTSSGAPIAASQVQFVFSAAGPSLSVTRMVPGKFTTSDPMLLVVSQTGQKGGTAVGGSAGAGKVYVITATPTA